jgi:ABC-type glycerol-3-phosphate transport system substrate-binding protein
VLRSPALITVNAAVLKKYGILQKEIVKPVDLFRVGSIVEEKTKGSIPGITYRGFSYHAALYGIVIKRKGEMIEFDVERMQKFLRETKPFIKKHHFKTYPAAGKEIFREKHCIHPHFWHSYPSERENNPSMIPIRVPLETNGFGIEGMLVASLREGNPLKEETSLFLSFMTSREGQTTLVKKSPNWLSVRNDVLEEQERNSPFPEGSVLYGFDPRSSHWQVDPALFKDYARKVNTETGKFFLDLQDMDKTIEKCSRS